MTFENRVKRYKAWKNLAEGGVPRPFGHPNWQDIQAEAKKKADDLLAKYPDVEVKEPEKEKSKKDK